MFFSILANKCVRVYIYIYLCAFECVIVYVIIVLLMFTLSSFIYMLHTQCIDVNTYSHPPGSLAVGNPRWP